ncbi:MAG TPA: trehalose-6-phosphate synthase, partial [Candidatus Omnitrophota bacterium]|nr:trehalose-6-phosphate synthase [Candidatus Omnitrophota bacterium]
MSKIIIASNRLPITVGNTIKKSSGGLVSALDGLFPNKDMLWVGWPGPKTSKFKDPQALRRRLIKDFGYYPIFLNQHEIDDYYDGFSNSCLWPALHYFPHYIHYTLESWKSYVKINQKFAEHIAANASDDDLIWIHDYHLFLVPQMLRSINPHLKIGFFLHTPFPSFEVFRCLPHREEILKGLLGSDVIGFHTYGYLRHFRSSAIRLLNTESDIDKILYGERSCKLGVFPIGINSRQFLNELSSPKFQQRKETFRSIHAGQKIVLGVERVDYTKGILRRFDAIEKFLRNRKKKTKVVFIFIGVPTRGEVKAYKDLLDQIQKRVGEINGEY